jgi:hypothetical protein
LPTDEHVSLQQKIIGYFTWLVQTNWILKLSIVVQLSQWYSKYEDVRDINIIKHYNGKILELLKSNELLKKPEPIAASAGLLHHLNPLYTKLIIWEGKKFLHILAMILIQYHINYRFSTIFYNLFKKWLLL